uniref:Secreted protein n=1 Tax=Fusarium oxysporum (strain Fo5176) TaxID=660025 RepID=A0A0D2XAR9_FUSOF
MPAPRMGRTSTLLLTACRGATSTPRMLSDTLEASIITYKDDSCTILSRILQGCIGDWITKVITELLDGFHTHISS